MRLVERRNVQGNVTSIEINLALDEAVELQSSLEGKFPRPRGGVVSALLDEMSRPSLKVYTCRKCGAAYVGPNGLRPCGCEF